MAIVACVANQRAFHLEAAENKGHQLKIFRRIRWRLVLAFTRNHSRGFSKSARPNLALGMFTEARMQHVNFGEDMILQVHWLRTHDPSLDPVGGVG